MLFSSVSELSLPWILILGSSLASILGATVVFLDGLVRKWTSHHDFTLSDNRYFITSVLSLSSGILFYSSQFVLIPEALEAIEKTPYFTSRPYFFLILFYICGMVFMFGLNKIIAIVAPSAIACPCSHENSSSSEIASIVIGNDEHEEHHDHNKCSNDKSHNHDLHSVSTERTKLISKSCSDINYSSVETLGTEGSYGRLSQYLPSSIFQDSPQDCECNFLASDQKCSEDIWSHIPIRDLEGFSHLSCKSSINRLSSASVLPISDSTKVIVPRDVEDRNQLWTIGIQTAIAVALHKLPEGLITVMGSESSERLGLNLFIGLACHNFPEGFMLAIPFYAATDSSLKAFCFASLIGGLTQPLGGLLGLLLLDRISPSHITYFNGVLFSLVAGLMLLVILQSFLPTIRRQLGHQSALPAIVSFMVGMIGMACVSSFFVH